VEAIAEETTDSPLRSPGFHVEVGHLANILRPSLRKSAHAAVSSAGGRNPGTLRPTATPGRQMTILFENRINRFQERSAGTADPSASLGMTKRKGYVL